MKRKLTIAAAALAMLAAFGFAGQMDYEDALAQQALYCDNVQSGVWPDYEDVYVSQCEPTHGPKKFKKSFVLTLDSPKI